MKTTATAPSNIAFIKYWGQKNQLLNIPLNDSISVNLDNLFTTTTVQFDPKLKKDSVSIDGKSEAKEVKRVSSLLDTIRNIKRSKEFAKVVSVNNFPKGSGLASSASGFAALAVAATAAAGLKLSEKELTTIARLGSGSASRSIPSGFVKWEKGKDHSSSYAHSIHPKNHWDINIIAVILSNFEKKIGSAQGHAMASTSPFYQARLKNLPSKIKDLEKALIKKDLKTFCGIVEQESLEMHSIMLTSTPSLIYWLPASIEVMKLCQKMRADGTLVYFTFDAGSQPILFCMQKDTKNVLKNIKAVKSIKKIIVNKPGDGAKLTNKHLF